MPDDAPQLVTQDELTALLGVSLRTIITWRQRGFLTNPTKEHGPRLLYDLNTVRADVLRHRLRVSPAFIQSIPVVS